MGDYRALKFIPTSHADRLEKEYEALLHFRKAAARLRSPHLVSIEHVGHNDAGLYYVMPLADGSSLALHSMLRLKRILRFFSVTT